MEMDFSGMWYVYVYFIGVILILIYAGFEYEKKIVKASHRDIVSDNIIMALLWPIMIGFGIFYMIFLVPILVGEKIRKLYDHYRPT